MIVKRTWKEKRGESYKGTREYRWCVGWFLFGIIPLYIQQATWEPSR